MDKLLKKEKITQAALVLPCLCIAIFIYNLSQSESAHHTAVIQTQGWYPETHS